jgi:hypothetical protein
MSNNKTEEQFTIGFSKTTGVVIVDYKWVVI